MSSETKIDFAQIATEIYDYSNNTRTFAIKSNRLVGITCTYRVLNGYSWFLGDLEHKWLHDWKDKRNAHLKRFGLVPPTIELTILEYTLREHFGEKE